MSEDPKTDPAQPTAPRGDDDAPTTPQPSPKRKDEILEGDLENTFPASDPVTPKHLT